MKIEQLLNQYKHYMTVRVISDEEEIPSEEISTTLKKGDNNGKEEDG